MSELQGLVGASTEVRVTELPEPYMKKLLAERFDLVAHRPPCGTQPFPAWATGRSGFAARRHRRLLSSRSARQSRRRLPDRRFRRRRGSSAPWPPRRRASARSASYSRITVPTGPTFGSISVPGAVAAGVGAFTWQRLDRVADASTRHGRPRPWSCADVPACAMRAQSSPLADRSDSSPDSAVNNSSTPPVCWDQGPVLDLLAACGRGWNEPWPAACVSRGSHRLACVEPRRQPEG